VGRATVTDGARPTAQRAPFKGPAARALAAAVSVGSSKAELTDNRVLHTVAPVVAPLALAVFPCAGSCAKSPHPSPGKRRAGGDRKLGAAAVSAPRRSAASRPVVRRLEWITD
jgi:hypothetical protein